jgi:mRNA-degrading endonuclease RelE of RelBE toxin-antitoxin system
MAAVRYDIAYAEEAVEDVRSLRQFERKKVLDGIETHLRHEPTKVSRSRIKRMTQPFWSEYRLRIENYRVYYDVDAGKLIVSILRILAKGQKETPKEADHETS